MITTIPSFTSVNLKEVLRNSPNPSGPYCLVTESTTRRTTYVFTPHIRADTEHNIPDQNGSGQQHLQAPLSSIGRKR
jgi:hypothetical protein